RRNSDGDLSQDPTVNHYTDASHPPDAADQARLLRTTRLLMNWRPMITISGEKSMPDTGGMIRRTGASTGSVTSQRNLGSPVLQSRMKKDPSARAITRNTKTWMTALISLAT